MYRYETIPKTNAQIGTNIAIGRISIASPITIAAGISRFFHVRKADNNNTGVNTVSLMSCVEYAMLDQSTIHRTTGA